jgi:hypothetical protein
LAFAAIQDRSLGNIVSTQFPISNQVFVQIPPHPLGSAIPHVVEYQRRENRPSLSTHVQRIVCLGLMEYQAVVGPTYRIASSHLCPSAPSFELVF